MRRISSGSSCSPSAVEPAMSANSTVTMRRSSVEIAIGLPSLPTGWVSSPFMGRLLRRVLPIHGEVGEKCPPHSWGGWGDVSSPFMGRWREAPEGLVLPIYGEVARSAGGAGLSHQPRLVSQNHRLYPIPHLDLFEQVRAEGVH